MTLTVVSSVANSEKKADEDLEISVVMPCLNESRTVGTCIDKAMIALEALGVCGEIIIADNGSDDGSQQIARDHGARVIDVAKRGYGHALSCRYSSSSWALYHHGRCR